MDVFKICVATVCYFVSRDLVIGAENTSTVLEYERLMNELTQRPATVHKIPAQMCSETHDPFVIFIRLDLVQVVQLDQIEQVMTIVACLYFEWRHEGLTWEPKSYGDHSAILMATEKVWVPELVIVVGDQDSLGITYPDTLKVNSSGVVSCMMASYITFRCQIDVRKYPFDSQTCNFRIHHISSLVNNVLTVYRLQGFTNLQENFRQNDPYSFKGEWSLINFSIEEMNIGDFTLTHFVLRMRRQRLFYIIVVIFPLVLTSFMIPLVFLIPGKSGEKISYLVTIYTSTAIFLTYISTVMPKNLSSAPFLAILLTEVLCQGFFAALAALWVVTKYNSGEICRQNKSSQEKTTLTHVDNITVSESVFVQEKTSQKVVSPPMYMRSSHGARSCGQQLTGRQLDLFFFSFFQTGQVVFLTSLLFATDWLE